jgi:Tfp pilus assembly protein PilX
MHRSTFNRSHRQGFALVVTLSLMILLTVIAVGLLSLSSVSLRSSAQGGMQAKAQANAKLALMLAIGELQKQLGPDQRVSANGAILSATSVSHPNWAGVWNSWQAGTPAIGTTSPDLASEHQTIAGAANSGMSPTYVAQRSDHFRAWLVSLNPTQAADISSAKNLVLTGSKSPGNTDVAVELVGDGSLGSSNAANFVKAGLVSVKSGTTSGRYGWWVGDESQKARIMEDSYNSKPAQSMAEKIFRQQAPGSTGTTTVKGLENMKNDLQLKGLPSLGMINLVDGATGKPAENFLNVTPFSYQVLADVREGGLKRDLSTLLERPINIAETGNEFMLYSFDAAAGQERVPIQDLAAFYQLYDSSRSGWQEGVKYTSPLVTSGLQITAPDYGSDGQAQYKRQYTALYRNPVPVKVQFLLSLASEPRTATPTNSDTHKLQLGITPSITFWNPTNVPLVLNSGSPATLANLLRLMNLPLLIKWNKNNGQFVSTTGVDMTWATQAVTNFKANTFSLYYSGNNPIVFAPGEVRVFSLPFQPNLQLNKTDKFDQRHEVAAGWDPNAFLKLPRSERTPNTTHVDANCLTFKIGDSIESTITNDNPSNNTEGSGSGLQFMQIQTSLQNATSGQWHCRHYMLTSRLGSGTKNQTFNSQLMSRGFPGGSNKITSSRSGSAIIGATSGNKNLPFLEFSLMAGCETNELSNGGAGAGRKFASRPFLHSTSISGSYIDDVTNDALYNYGWNWTVQPINSILEAASGVKGNQGYYGGGYTGESGTTHVVQQEIPVTPPMAIAALSHAHLGGFSLANEAAAADYNALVNGPTSGAFQKTTALGQGGLFPHTLQAIGNSYAHPHIPADKASTSWNRTFSADTGPIARTLADHSYLANKALWDDYFFSSISPAPAKVRIYGGTKDRSAQDVAKDFFFPAATAAPIPLPNRRIAPYSNNLDSSKLTSLFTQAPVYTDGMADKIAAHLMVEGPFNVNSTSIEAWKIFLSSLKGKPVAFLDKDTALTGGLALGTQTPAGTPVGPVTLPNGKTYSGSSTDPSDEEQWTGWRELSTTEITELATAIVKEVKLRGPFLSLSEFVNRRLDSSNTDLSVKGALQAALDDNSVSINAGFRNAVREFSLAELNGMNPKFPDALKGPIAYGSSAYVDQADILRNFSEQLTPRGDTFVIRAYGDALDATGRVEARAWCEAVVQRTPEYLDPVDEAHLKSAALTSSANKTFGRKLRTVNFRWLNQNEI